MTISCAWRLNSNRRMLLLLLFDGHKQKLCGMSFSHIPQLLLLLDARLDETVSRCPHKNTPRGFAKGLSVAGWPQWYTSAIFSLFRFSILVVASIKQHVQWDHFIKLRPSGLFHLLRSLFSSRTFIHSHNHSHPHTDCCDWGRIYRHPPAIPFSHASFSKPESDPLARPTTCRVIEWVREYRKRGRLNTCERGRLWSLLGWPGFIVTFYHIPAQRWKCFC